MLSGRLVGTSYSALKTTGGIISWGLSGVTSQTIDTATHSAGDLLVVFWASSGSTGTWPTNSSWTHQFTGTGFAQRIYFKIADGDATDDFDIPSNGGGYGMAQMAAFSIKGTALSTTQNGGTGPGASTSTMNYYGIADGGGSLENIIIFTGIKNGGAVTSVNPEPPVNLIGYAHAGFSRPIAWGYVYTSNDEPAVTQGDWRPNIYPTSGEYGITRRQRLI